MEEGLRILEAVKATFEIPVLTDIHETKEAAVAAEIADVLQIPSLLCRQTDLLIAAAETGRPVNIKKGQFMAPWEMKNAVEKVRSADCDEIMLTERGSCFGYNNLVVDFRSIPLMQKLGVPVVFDGSHTVQRPGAQGDSSGGDAALAPYLVRAGVAAGADGLFLEVHPNPSEALSDGQNSLALDRLRGVLETAISIRKAVASATDVQDSAP
jgi:2-dehydro-3-deoxyphosphooctonate aldolase (KDO 8-P synthase)